jgi:hypothetical protein
VSSSIDPLINWTFFSGSQLHYHDEPQQNHSIPRYLAGRMRYEQREVSFLCAYRAVAAENFGMFKARGAEVNSEFATVATAFVTFGCNNGVAAHIDEVVDTGWRRVKK